MLVCGHGGNAEALVRAVATLRSESRDVRLFLPRWQGDPHAGHEETSMLLALDAARVQLAKAVPGDTRPLGQTLPLLREGGVIAVSATASSATRPGPTPLTATRCSPDSRASCAIRSRGADGDWTVSERGSDRVAVVTGAARGIGAATVLALGRRWVDRARRRPGRERPGAAVPAGDGR